MNKVVLSTALIFSFGIYALALRFQGHDDGSRSIAPNPVSTTSTATTTAPSNTAASSPPPTNTFSSSTPSTSTTTTNSGKYKNGTYTGPVADAYYGNVQVKVTISGGKITDVTFLDYPHDRNTSQQINSQAMPYLKQEAIQAQSANVSGVSGASLTSAAFEQSLSGALSQAA